MISLTKFNQICQEWVNEIPELESHVLVAQDSHASRKLADLSGIHLVAVMPSAVYSGQPNHTVPEHTTYLFVLYKASSGETDEEEVTHYEACKNVILQIREYIEESHTEGCGPFWRLETDGISIDPEYNAFGGWNGYSMLFSF